MCRLFVFRKDDHNLLDVNSDSLQEIWGSVGVTQSNLLKDAVIWQPKCIFGNKKPESPTTAGQPIKCNHDNIGGPAAWMHNPKSLGGIQPG